MKYLIALVLAVAATAPVVTPSTVDAQAAVCTIDPRTRLKKCRIQIDGPDVEDVVREIGTGTGASLFRWLRFNFGSVEPSGPGGGIINLCPIRETTAVDAAGTETITSEFGVYYYIILERVDTGETVSVETICVYPGDAVPEPPPPPPTEGEFRAAAEPILTFGTELNPRVAFGGITGLDTWLWCISPGQTPVGLTLRGWTAAATIDPVGMAWNIGGTSDEGFQRTDCGSEDDPAVTWQPQTKGGYSIEFVSTWAGTWTLSYDGFPPETFALGPFDFPSPALDYDVDEFVGVLTDE